MRYLTILALVALAACKAEKTRGANDSVGASTGAAADSGPAPADSTKAATRRP